MVDENNILVDGAAAPEEDEEDLLAGIPRSALDLSHLDGDFPQASPSSPPPPRPASAPPGPARPAGGLVEEMASAPARSLSSPFVHVSRRTTTEPTVPAAPSSLNLDLAPVSASAASAPSRDDFVAVAKALGLTGGPPPPAAPEPEGDDFSIDSSDGNADDAFSDALAIDEEAPVSQSAYAGISVLVADPQQGLDGPVAKTLLDFGFACTVVETGEAARQELASGRYPVAILMTGADSTWARMLLATGRQRWQGVRFMAGLAAVDSAAVLTLAEAGALDVLEPPFPTGTALLARLHAVLPEQVAPPAMDPGDMQRLIASAQDRLRRAAAEVEAKAREAAARAQAQAQALAAAAPAPRPEPARDTGAASREVQSLREHLRGMETRFNETRSELATVKLRNMELEARCKQLESAGTAAAPTPPPPPATTAANAAQLETLKAYIKTLEERGTRERGEMERLRSRNEELEKQLDGADVPTASTLSASYHESSYEVALVELRDVLTSAATMRQAVDSALDFLTPVAASAGPNSAEATKSVKLLRNFQKIVERAYERLGI